MADSTPHPLGQVIKGLKFDEAHQIAVRVAKLPAAPLKAGDSGPKVHELQEALKQLKFLLAPPSGSLDAITSRALGKFQHLWHVHTDDHYDKATRHAMAKALSGQKPPDQQLHLIPDVAVPERGKVWAEFTLVDCDEPLEKLVGAEVEVYAYGKKHTAKTSKGGVVRLEIPGKPGGYFNLVVKTQGVDRPIGEGPYEPIKAHKLGTTIYKLGFGEMHQLGVEVLPPSPCDNKAEIEELQQALQKLKYLHAHTAGTWDRASRHALGQFQVHWGLKHTDKYDAATREALSRALRGESPPSDDGLSERAKKEMAALLKVAERNASGKPALGKCLARVQDYLDQVTYGTGKVPRLPYAHDYADYLNRDHNAHRLGLKRLHIDNPYAAPAGSVIVVRAGTPGTHHPTAGDIVVRGHGSHFYNDGEMGYGGAGNFPKGNNYVLGVFVPE